MLWYVADAELLGLKLDDADPGLTSCLIEVALKLLDFDAGTHANELGAPQKCRLHCRCVSARRFEWHGCAPFAGTLGR